MLIKWHHIMWSMLCRSMSHINRHSKKYLAHFHSVIKYRITVQGNSSYSKNTSIITMKPIQIMVGEECRNAYRSLSKRLLIRLHPCKHILSSMTFTVNSQENFQTNTIVWNINTRNKHHLKQTNCQPLKFSDKMYNAGITIFNNFPCHLTNLKNERPNLNQH